ncbi:hypothetical protein IGI41_000562 [Enterococcus sp. DIV0876]
MGRNEHLEIFLKVSDQFDFHHIQKNPLSIFATTGFFGLADNDPDDRKNNQSILICLIP